MLKQIEIKVSLCKKSGIHQPIRLRKDGFTAENLSNLQNLTCCKCLKLRSNCPTLLINTIFITAQSHKNKEVDSHDWGVSWADGRNLALA